MRYHRSRSVNCSAVCEEAGDAQKGAAGAVMLAMWAGDGDRGLAGMLGLSADRLEQQRPTGDRLAMLVGVGQADEQVPPIGGERDDAGHELAAFNVVGGETAPAPLVLQFVEVVLGIAAVAIELGDGEQLAFQRGHQHGVFPRLTARVPFDKAQLQRRFALVRVAAGGTLGQQHLAQAPAQQHDAALPALGCGPGRDLSHFRSLGHESVGLDGSLQFVAMARSHSQCEVLHQDFLAMQLPENRFDGVFANASLFHVPSQEMPKVLLELLKTLKPRGALFS